MACSRQAAMMSVTRTFETILSMIIARCKSKSASSNRIKIIEGTKMVWKSSMLDCGLRFRSGVLACLTTMICSFALMRVSFQNFYSTNEYLDAIIAHYQHFYTAVAVWWRRRAYFSVWRVCYMRSFYATTFEVV